MLLDQSYYEAFCELKSVHDELLTTGKIIKIGDDFLEFSNDEGVKSLLRYEKNVKVIIHHPSQSVKTIEGILYVPTMHFFRVIDVKTRSVKEQRNFFRITVTLPARLSLIARSGGILRQYDGTIHDISLGGAIVNTKGAITLKQEIILQFKIQDIDISLPATIIRSTNQMNNEIGYGVAFSEISDNVNDVLFKYLIAQQNQ